MKNVTLFRNWLLLALVMLTGNAMAQVVLLEEDFSKCTSKNPDSPSDKVASMDDITAVPGWTSANGYVGEGNMKFGAKSSLGTITTPTLDLSDANATYTLSFKACAWSGDQTSVKVSVDDQEAVVVEGLTNAAAPYAANMKEFSLEVKGTAASTITIAAFQASKARFFLDDIKVTKLSSGEIALPSVKAPVAVNFGTAKVGESLTSELEIFASDLTGDLTVAVTGNGFSCETTTIAKDEAASKVLTVAFTANEVGAYDGVLTISGGGLEEAVTVQLMAVMVNTAGNGTKENPYTLADVIQLNNPATKAWVKGFIGGYVDNNTFKFSADGALKTNLFLAPEATTTEAELCVSVQLPNTAVRTDLNLADHPENLGKEVLIYGSLEAYFNVPGVKNVAEYEFVGGGSEVPVPSVKAPATVDLGATKMGVPLTSEVKISASDLTGDLTVSIEGAGFSCETTTIAKDEAASAVLNVTFTAEEGGAYNGVLTISGGGLEEAVTVQLTASVVMTSGSGTKEDPYTVADVILLNNPKTKAWVKGFIGGFVNNNNWIFTAEGAVATNIFLSTDGVTTEKENTITVQLQGTARTDLGLADHPENLGKEVLIYGSLEAYFNIPGVKSVSTDYEFTGNAVGVKAVMAGDNAPVEVYTLGGVKVGNTLEGLAKGIYVVKQGDRVKKVIK